MTGGVLPKSGALGSKVHVSRYLEGYITKTHRTSDLDVGRCPELKSDEFLLNVMYPSSWRDILNSHASRLIVPPETAAPLFALWENASQLTPHPHSQASKSGAEESPQIQKQN